MGRNDPWGALLNWINNFHNANSSNKGINRDIIGRSVTRTLCEAYSNFIGGPRRPKSHLQPYVFFVVKSVRPYLNKLTVPRARLSLHRQDNHLFWFDNVASPWKFLGNGYLLWINFRNDHKLQKPVVKREPIWCLSRPTYFGSNFWTHELFVQSRYWQ